MDYTSLTGPELTIDDNNISAPEQAPEAIGEMPDADPVANVLDETDVTGIRETSEQTNFIDQTENLVVPQDDVGQENTGVAVRRAIADNDESNLSENNADSEILDIQRGQGVRHQNVMNFVSDPKADIGNIFDKSKKFNSDRLPRNQRDYQESKNSKTEHVDSNKKDTPFENQIVNKYRYR